MTGEPRPFVNPLIEVSAFDSDAAQPMVLCVLPTADEPVRLALPTSYMTLARQFDGTRTVDEAIDAFLREAPAPVGRERLQRLVRDVLLPKGILVLPDQDPASVATSSRSRRGFLFVKLPIIPADAVAFVARRLGVLFTAPMLVVGLLTFVFSHLYVYGVAFHGRHVDINQLDAADIVLIMLLSTLATICHEFGHASAAARYGCRRMTIGWGIYIVYTVLWTNVSEAWRLTKRQRAVVDIGGVYFEGLFLCLVLLAYVASGNPLFLFAFVFIDLSIATNFNPFLRMDGYWLVSDLFGIVNLRKQQIGWLHELAGKVFPGVPRSTPTTLTPRAKTVLAVYSLLGSVFMTYLFVMIAKFVVVGVATDYPALLRRFGGDVAAGAPVMTLLGRIVEIGWRTVLLVGAAVMLANTARKLFAVVDAVVRYRTNAMQRGERASHV